MDKKQGTILKQIMKPFILSMMVLILANAIILTIFTTSYYLSDQHKEASQLAKNATAEFESFRAIGWLLDYWEQNHENMDMIYGGSSLLDEKIERLRHLNPELGELSDVDVGMAEKMDGESQKLFAEICYNMLSSRFDLMKQSHQPLYLYSFRIRGDNMFILVTGTKDGEKRTSQGGDLFELGTLAPYRQGAYPVMDEIIRTQKPVDNMELSRAKGADPSIVHVFHPVYADGEMTAIVGVSIRSSEMISQIIRMLCYVLIITLSFFAIMLALIIHQLRKVVVIPIGKEQKIIEEYEESKDSVTASQSLDSIKTGNEIERMADSFRSMVVELDRYMEEIKAVTGEKERIEAELNVATTIQASMLPRTFPPFPGRSEFDLYATMTPAKEVGGDLYNFFLIDDDHLGLVIGDVSGKGVPAALFMMVTNILIANRTKMGGGPAEILASVNDNLCEHNEAEMFVTVWLAVIEISTGKGMAANAGHEHPAIRRSDGKWDLEIYKHSPACATMEGIVFREHEFELHPGDSLFVYTDGVTEATDSNNELFGNDRLLAALNSCAGDDPEEVLNAVKKSIDEFVGDAPQFDDITMLGMRYNG